MRLARHYLLILALIGAVLGSQGIALFHAQAHGHSHDWVSEQLGEHACAVIDQLASATPTSHCAAPLPSPYASPQLVSVQQTWFAKSSAAWQLARAPPTASLSESLRYNVNLLL
jgi:hypothetical protein